MKPVLFPLTKNKSPAVPKDTDWKLYTGPVKTPMIGVMVPTGAIVIDIDTYKGVTTDDIEKALGCTLNWAEAELQETLNGGMHYAFKVPTDSNLISGADVLGVKGFDTRAAGKGYIATGEGYEDLTLLGVVDTLHEVECLPELPALAVNLLTSGSTVASDDEDGLMEAISSEPLDLSDDEVSEYMGRLTQEQSECSDTWLKVMMGLWHQTKGSDFGWSLFDTFSKLSEEKYDKRKNKARWDSMARSKRTNPVTFASIIEMTGGARKLMSTDKFDRLTSMVQEADTKPDLSKALDEVATHFIDELNMTIIVRAIIKQFQMVFGEKLTAAQVRKILKSKRPTKKSDFYEDYVFITQTGEYMQRDTKTTMGPRAFDVKHSRDTPPDEEGNPQGATNFVNTRIECVHSGMYAPMFDDIFIYDGIEYFNTYKPNMLSPVPAGTTDIVDRIKGHIAHLLVRKDEQDIVINYLAHNVQYPGKKIPWSPILQGVQGDGKSFLAEMMKHVLGYSNCETMNVESLEEKFTPWAEGNCMVFIEELKLDNYRKYETLNKLKPYITNPMVSVRKMRTDSYECINTTNYFALTNFKDALPIDDNDRRYCVMFSQWQSKEKLTKWMAENPDYYPSLYEAMRTHPGEILHWLMNHKIPESFTKMSRAPDTSAKTMMVDMAKSDDYLLVEDAINEFSDLHDDIGDYVVNVTKLARMATDVFEDRAKDFPKTTRLRNILLDMGYQPIGRYKDDARKNQLIYCKDDSKEAKDFKPDVPF